jgi:hypothetical protein
MCAVVRLRALLARQAAQLITKPPITTVCQHISGKLGITLYCLTLSAAIVNGIVLRIVHKIERSCRRSLTLMQNARNVKRRQKRYSKRTE